MEGGAGVEAAAPEGRQGVEPHLGVAQHVEGAQRQASALRHKGGGEVGGLQEQQAQQHPDMPSRLYLTIGARLKDKLI